MRNRSQPPPSTQNTFSGCVWVGTFTQLSRSWESAHSPSSWRGTFLFLFPLPPGESVSLKGSVAFRHHNGQSVNVVHANLHQHHDRYFRIPLGVLNQPGIHTWRIKSISDAFNLTTTYQAVGIDQSIEIPEMKVEVFDRPDASLGATSLSVAQNYNASIPVSLKGHPPFVVVIQLPQPGGGYVQENFTEMSSFSLSTKVQGVYRLISARDGTNSNSTSNTSPKLTSLFFSPLIP